MTAPPKLRCWPPDHELYVLQQQTVCWLHLPQVSALQVADSAAGPVCQHDRRLLMRQYVYARLTLSCRQLDLVKAGWNQVAEQVAGQVADSAEKPMSQSDPLLPVRQCTPARLKVNCWTPDHKLYGLQQQTVCWQHLTHVLALKVAGPAG